MTSLVVCDASVLVAALVDSGEDGSRAAAALMTADLAAPSLLPFETANVLRRHERAGIVSRDGAAQAHADLLDLPIELWPYEPLAPRTWELRGNLSSYDAAYVALAELLGTPLLTLDRRIGEAAGVRCAVEAP